MKPTRRTEAARLFELPLLELVFRAAAVHREHHDPRDIQRSTLLSIKTGGCPEDCGYCPQSAHYATGLEREPLMDVAAVARAARTAKAQGADRFCIGAAWREVRDGVEFDTVLGMVEAIKGEGLETCATLGMMREDHAARLRDAGLDYYNHNLDSSASFYGRIITTRTYQDRLDTLAAARAAGLKLCCGGIVGMGESDGDRIDLLATLASLDPPPESVPLNSLVPAEGTPLAGRAPVAWHEMVRVVAVARLLMPRSRIRLSAGRLAMSEEAQALCFLAGANSIFLGDRLLTTPNAEPDADERLLGMLGAHPAP